ncbi:type II toxin-antitoxin system ParD family antitoxin [Pseudomonas vanderleydeniana]|uniref:Type II toxin-antitoxin system ParD family antitoxin n=1 Tax=Pseudomonas vanderleydeniana TaxID=2745495 RepID=A0A9E6PH88_9PSED|nr:type II toxin-antitoxin system ParD family antitoxin [Pseudomonas vanderleydeniana]QXI26409.1 type II toxin-antitoxin system ParD family antitoxin [Pseudomonas vanderleydeniana]
MSAKRVVLTANPDQVTNDLFLSARDQHTGDAVHEEPNSIKQLEEEDRTKLKTLRCSISTGLMDLAQGRFTESSGEQLEPLLTHITDQR